MDGLEISEINYSVMLDTITLRFDSEYYKKEYIVIENNIKENHNKYVKLSALDLTIDASAFYPALEPYYNTGNIPFIRVGDVHDNIDYDNCIKIPLMSDDYKTLNLCKSGDLVLTKGGRIGTASLIEKDSYVCRDLISISSHNLPKKDYVMLYLYFSTDFMQKQILRSSSMTAQPHLTITMIRELLIYKFTDKFKNIILDIYEKSKSYMNGSADLYRNAEQLLDESFGFQKFEGNKLYNCVNLSESFCKSGRIDAEYYQPKYDQLFNLLSIFNCCKLSGDSGLTIINKSIEPGSDEYATKGIPFVRVSNLDKFGIYEPDVKISYDIVDNIENLYPKKDDILITKDGSVGIAYQVEKNEKIITSGAILRLTIKDRSLVLPEYLTLVLNSPIVKLQAERDSNGAIIQHWKPSEISNVVIPLLDISVQKDIAKLVRNSFDLRRQSERLLEIAKKAVEIAIETNEDNAINWINVQIEKEMN